jgi:TonB family protein
MTKGRVDEPVVKEAFALVVVIVAMIGALLAIDYLRHRPLLGGITPSPAATKCTGAYHTARVIAARSPMYPVSAVALHLPKKTVYVAVTIDAMGSLVQSKIWRTSGNAAMDAAALEAARESTFAPATRKCAPVTSKAAMRFVFNPVTEE